MGVRHGIRRARWLATLAAVGAAGLALSAPAGAQSSGEPRVVFYSNRGGNDDLYLLADGEVTPFALESEQPGYDPENPGVFGFSSATAPTWSPDGSKVAATFHEGSSSVILLLDAATGERVASFVGDGGHPNAPSWSPDGSEIVFHDTNTSLQVYDVASETISPLPGDTVGGLEPAFSPDGSKIAYLLHQPSNTAHPPTDVVVVNRDDGSVLSRRESQSFYEDLAWSPDGTQLALYNAGNACIATLVTMAADGSGPETAVHEDGCFYYGIDWTDDDELVFGMEPVGELSALFAINPDGTGFRRLTDPAGDAIDAYPAVIGTGVIAEGSTTTEPTTAPTTAPTSSPPAPTSAPQPGDSSGGLTVSASTVAPGGSLTVSGDGFAPGSSITLTLFSDPVALGTATAGDDGAFSTSVEIPAGVSAGSHRIVASGTAPDGSARSLEVTITVTGARTTLPATGSNQLAAVALALVLIGLGVHVHRARSAVA